MAHQLTQDWNARFAAGDTPWEDEQPSDAMAELLRRYVKRGSKVLDVGCGLGTNAIWMAANGYIVQGVDISEAAVAQAAVRAAQAGITLRFQQMDFLSPHQWDSPFDTVVDRGCLHSLCSRDARASFGKRVAESLMPGGLWINISGSADNPDPPGERERQGYPRLSVADIVAASEGWFDVVEIRRCTYGTGTETGFLAFASLLQKR